VKSIADNNHAPIAPTEKISIYLRNLGKFCIAVADRPTKPMLETIAGVLQMAKGTIERFERGNT
jgi:hypothetical protein